jgi:hypothetical protein
MAFLFCDSFDHYATADLLTKWSQKSAVPTIAAVGRNSTSGLKVDTTSGSVSKTLPASGATCVIGFARKPTDLGIGASFLVIGDATVRHISLSHNIDGTISVRRAPSTLGAVNSGTLLGTSTATATEDQYDYWELKVLIDDSAGTVTLRKNGVDAMTPLTGQDTRNGGTAGWSSIEIGNESDYDDLYVLDGSGSAPHNTFYGDVRVAAHLPNANGANSESTPSTGSDRYATVDETAPNSDTDYNTLAAVNDKDTLGLTNLIPTGAAIIAFQTAIFAKKTDAGVGSVCPVIRHSGTDNDGAGVALSTAYAYTLKPYETNPGTLAQITESEFNALEVGYKRTA